MSNLLIHSMSEFSEIILPALEIAGAKDVAEIGAEFGGMSFRLADHCAAAGGSLHSIDPSPKQQFLDWVAGADHVQHIALPSLDAIPALPPVDAWVIDGDHNWYSVYHETRAMRDACRAHGKPVLAFFHDIHWPSGRRDSYYAPERIPAEFRHPYSYEGGCTPGNPGLRDGRGFRGMGQMALACHEGGPRNGVLTAIEDFLAEEYAAGVEYGFAEVPGVFGLGVLFDLDAEWSGALAELVLPLHLNKLLQVLEGNRLANYLRVIEMQDEASEQAASAA